MVDQALEHRRLEEAQLSRLRKEVPDDARAVGRGRYGLLVVRRDLDTPNTAAMLLEGGIHRLCLEANVPDADLSLHASRHDATTIRCQCQGGDAVLVRVVDGVEELATLRKEGPHLAVRPSRDDGLPVPHEVNAEAFHVWNLDAQELLPRHRIPNADVRHRAGGEDLGVVRRESDLIDALMVASVAELCCEGIHVDPVDVGEGGATEEMRAVLRECQRGHSSQHLALLLHTQRVRRYPREASIASAYDDVSVRQQRRGGDAQRKGLARSATGCVLLEEGMGELHLQQVPGGGAAVDKLVLMIHQHIGRDALHLTKVGRSGSELLVRQVELPNHDVVVATCHQAELGVVEEADAMRRVSGRRRAADSKAPLHLPNHQAVVVLPTQRSQVGLVAGEGQRRHRYFVQRQSMQLLPLLEVPDDDIRRKAHEGFLS
mmetsp:Transcript_50891/g.121716  ORF Transcript_50891/g.121716 Transcript_50891/m.121716 type:complete len:431 (-) Transcript_50891:287-1579(-)